MSESAVTEVPTEIPTVTEVSADVADALAHVHPLTSYEPAVFNAVYDKMKHMIVNKEFNLGNWVNLVTLTMEVVEVVPGLHGIQKRDLVVDLIAKLVTEIPMSETDRALVSGLVKTMLPGIIDAIVQSSLGEIALNIAEKAEEHITKCWAHCQK